MQRIWILCLNWSNQKKKKKKKNERWIIYSELITFTKWNTNKCLTQTKIGCVKVLGGIDADIIFFSKLYISREHSHEKLINC